MYPHRLTLPICLALFLFNVDALGQRKVPTGGRIAVVVDERLAALRSTPQLNGKLIRRLGRGRLVAITSSKTDRDGVVFYQVNVTTRTRGWIQRESVVSPSRAGDDLRLLRLIQSSHGFDRISRARIFLDQFRRSPSRPTVLLILGDTAEELAAKLTQSAARKLNTVPFAAPEHSYYLNHPSLDRYNRQGINFLFNPSTKRLHYDGSAWRLLVRHHPTTPEAAVARQRLIDK
ncbi:MAG TPA: SH3 domain-containing protein [Pyrinomonadaceae bacterium]|nr:SH3 domain-containing protein [Pyrinomonadaceae bacterium]